MVSLVSSVEVDALFLRSLDALKLDAFAKRPRLRGGIRHFPAKSTPATGVTVAHSPTPDGGDYPLDQCEMGARLLTAVEVDVMTVGLPIIGHCGASWWTWGSLSSIASTAARATQIGTRGFMAAEYSTCKCKFLNREVTQ